MALTQPRPATVERLGAEAALELRGVHKRFGPISAVHGIDVTIRSGEIVAYLGPNGAGKTSTIDMILGLTHPSEGEVRVCGHRPRDAVRRGLVSAVMQSGGLLQDLTVGETLRYIAELFPTSRPVNEVLERSGLTELRDRLVGKCSGGEQQRLRFTMALLPDPQLLVLDEPTQGMDVEGRRDFWRAMRGDVTCGRTVLFATHYLEEADAYADRVVVLRNGEIVADGTAAEVKALSPLRIEPARALPACQRRIPLGVGPQRDRLVRPVHGRRHLALSKRHRPSLIGPPRQVRRRAGRRGDRGPDRGRKVLLATLQRAVLRIAHLYYRAVMVSGDLIREARLRAGLRQSELGERLGKAQSVIARWESGRVQPSLETVRRVVQVCGLDLGFHLSTLDDSSAVVIDEHLQMTPAQRFTDLMARVRFHEQLDERRRIGHG